MIGIGNLVKPAFLKGLVLDIIILFFAIKAFEWTFSLRTDLFMEAVEIAYFLLIHAVVEYFTGA